MFYISVRFFHCLRALAAFSIGPYYASWKLWWIQQTSLAILFLHDYRYSQYLDPSGEIVLTLTCAEFKIICFGRGAELLSLHTADEVQQEKGLLTQPGHATYNRSDSFLPTVALPTMTLLPARKLCFCQTKFLNPLMSPCLSKVRFHTSLRSNTPWKGYWVYNPCFGKHHL